MLGANRFQGEELQVESRSHHTRLPISQIIEVIFAPTGLLGLHQGCCDLPMLHVCVPVKSDLDGARSHSEFLLSPPHFPIFRDHYIPCRADEPCSAQLSPSACAFPSHLGWKGPSLETLPATKSWWHGLLMVSQPGFAL